jgi:hypothetical protein
MRQPAPGTVVSVAGGYCDGYPALGARISPVRVAIDPSDGTPWWTDDDGSVTGVWAGPHPRGSMLIRHLDRAGRVRTLGPLFPPDEGRAFRQHSYYSPWLTSVQPDGHGGAFVNLTADPPEVQISSVTQDGPDRAFGDVPTSSGIWQLHADGTRTLIVGGKERTLAQLSAPTPVDGDGDPVTATALGFIESFSVDPQGNVYLVDSSRSADDGPTGSTGTLRVRFANRSAAPVVFFAGTADMVTVAPGRIGTIAGLLATRSSDHGDGGHARTASFGQVPALAVRGDLVYLLDHYPHDGTDSLTPGGSVTGAIRVINAGRVTRVVAGTSIAPGVIDRVAGDTTGESGFSGDGGSARAARFHFHFVDNYGDLAVDAHGDIHVVDSGNLRLRRVDGRTGVITTEVGDGNAGASPSGTTATTAHLWRPTGVAIDRAGRPVVVDYNSARLRTLASGRLIDTVGRGPTPCGDGHLATGTSVNSGATFGEIRDVATDSRGRVYVADGTYNTVRRIDRNGRVSLVVGVPTNCAGPEYGGAAGVTACPQLGTQSGDGGPPDKAGLAEPSFLLVDTYDNLYISDIDRIRYVNFSSKPVSVQGVTVAPGAIQTLHVFPARSVHIHLAAPGIGVYDFDVPLTMGDLAVDAHGNLFVADQYLNVVDRIGPCGDLSVVVGNGSPPKQGGDGDGDSALKAGVVPAGLAYDTGRDVLYVFDAGTSAVYVPLQPQTPNVLTPDGRNLFRPTATHATRIRAVNLGVARVRAYGLLLAPGVINSVAGLADCKGDCSSGDGSSSLKSGISGRSTLALSRDGRLYFADSVFNRLRVILPDGRVAGIAGPWPQVAGADTRFQNIFNNHTVVADGYLGDGGPALNAWFTTRWISGHSGYSPAALTTTPSGDVVFADFIGRVRRIIDSPHAPLRLGETLPALVGAGQGFGTAVPLRSTLETEPAMDPDVVVEGEQTFVVGSRGTGSGCDLWSLTDDVDGRGHDAGTYLGQVGLAEGGSAGGRFCAVAQPRGPTVLGSGPRLAAVTPGDVPPASSAGLLTATTDDGGSSWRSGFAGTVPERAGSIGDLGRASILGGTTMTMAFTNSSGTLSVATSPDGSEYLPVGRINATPAAVGDLASGPKDERYLAFVDKTTVAGMSSYGISVATSVDGLTWSVAKVTQPRRTPTSAPNLSAPSIAVDPGGVAYVTWSDLSHVYLARQLAPGRWTSPVVVPGGSVNVLPTIVATNHGIAIASYGSPVPRTYQADNPYAAWYVYVAQLDNPTRPGARFHVRVASSSAALTGPICTTDGCWANQAALATIGFPASPEPGRVRVRTDSRGALHLAFAVEPSRLGNASGGTTVAYLRSCFSLLSQKAALPDCAQHVLVSAPTPPSSDAPPDLTPPPADLSPVLPCSPVPPPAPAAADGPAPAQEQPQPVPAHHDARPPVVAVVPFLEPPMQPALPAGQAPAQAMEPSSSGQSATQPGAQPQTGAQIGVATEQERQREAARNFNYSRPASPYPSPIYVWLLTGAGVTVGWAARRRRAAAPARITISSR